MALENIDRSLRLPDGDYFHPDSPSLKTGIALHHTVGYSVHSTVSWWRKNGQNVGTAYLIARDGTIYEVFDPKAWAWQFGLKWPKEQKLQFEKRFIGIEIASEGGLTKSNGNLYCFSKFSDRTRKDWSEAFDYGEVYREYQYFDKYENAQVDSVISLINYLCQEFNIKRQLPSDYLGFHGKKLTEFEGIIGHSNVRMDKSDPVPDHVFWKRIIDDTGLQSIILSSKTKKEKNMLTPEKIKKIKQDNESQFIQMDRDSCNMVKQLLSHLQAKGFDTYISLYNPQKNGSIVHFKMEQGNFSLVKSYAETLGFTSCDERGDDNKHNRLEV